MTASNDLHALAWTQAKERAHTMFAKGRTRRRLPYVIELIDWVFHGTSDELPQQMSCEALETAFNCVQFGLKSVFSETRNGPEARILLRRNALRRS